MFHNMRCVLIVYMLVCFQFVAGWETLRASILTAALLGQDGDERWPCRVACVTLLC